MRTRIRFLLIHIILLNCFISLHRYFIITYRKLVQLQIKIRLIIDLFVISVCNKKNLSSILSMIIWESPKFSYRNFFCHANLYMVIGQKYLRLSGLALHLAHAQSLGLVDPKKKDDWRKNLSISLLFNFFSFTFTCKLIKLVSAPIEV